MPSRNVLTSVKKKKILIICVVSRKFDVLQLLTSCFSMRHRFSSASQLFLCRQSFRFKSPAQSLDFTSKTNANPDYNIRKKHYRKQKMVVSNCAPVMPKNLLLYFRDKVALCAGVLPFCSPGHFLFSSSLILSLDLRRCPLQAEKCVAAFVVSQQHVDVGGGKRALVTQVGHIWDDKQTANNDKFPGSE